MQFCVNPSPLQHITLLADVCLVPVLAAGLLCVSGWLMPLLSLGFCVWVNLSRPLFMIQSLCIPLFSMSVLLAGICVRLQWPVLAAEVVLWPWHDSQTSTWPAANSTRTLSPFLWSSTVSSASLSILLHMSSSSIYCLSFSLSFPCVVCCEDSRETQPHFPSHLPGKPKWKDTSNLFSLLPRRSP